VLVDAFHAITIQDEIITSMRPALPGGTGFSPVISRSRHDDCYRSHRPRKRPQKVRDRLVAHGQTFARPPPTCCRHTPSRCSYNGDPDLRGMSIRKTRAVSMPWLGSMGDTYGEALSALRLLRDRRPDKRIEIELTGHDPIRLQDDAEASLEHAYDKAAHEPS
jgi:hypothetical protein